MHNILFLVENCPKQSESVKQFLRVEYGISRSTVVVLSIILRCGTAVRVKLMVCVSYQ